jgi:hypothetical protein
MKTRHAQRRPSLEMNRRRKTIVYTALVLTWLTGAAWLLLHYFFQRQGDFGSEPHPLEFWMLAMHGACAFAVLWLLGWIWTTHIVPWWSGGRRRRASGVVLISFAVVLIASGYLLYYGSGDALREWTGVIHWSIGLAAAIPVFVHALRSRRYRSA